MPTRTIDEKVVTEITTNGATPAPRHRESRTAGMVWGLLRIAMGWTFLWAFLDKAFALGFSTGRNPETGVIDVFGKDAWINGGSPTDGVLIYALKGPFKGCTTAWPGRAGSSGPTCCRCC